MWLLKKAILKKTVLRKLRVITALRLHRGRQFVRSLTQRWFLTEHRPMSWLDGKIGGKAQLQTASVDYSTHSRGLSRSQGLWSSAKARERSYWAESSAPADTLWQLVSNLTDLVHWHPIIAATNAPLGQKVKPGLIYKAFSRYIPLSTPIFVERVLPGELMSLRLFPLPGVQERVTYRIVSTLCGTCVLYSMTLSGWLSPFVWPMMKPQATRVAAALVQAAEEATAHANDPLYTAPVQADIFG